MVENRHILHFLIFLSFNIYCQECTSLNPYNYGDCEEFIGYVWYEESCVPVYGCGTNNDTENFFNNYESCDLTCNPEFPLGDLNNDFIINVTDIISLVSIILLADSNPNQSFIANGDINFDNQLNVTDIIILVNYILSDEEVRGSWQIINEDILSLKCAQCHYEGSFYAETSDLILTQNVAYNQLINRVPNNSSAMTDELVLISNASGLLGILQSYFWEKINIKNENHFYTEHPQYGELMPLGGPFLTNGELNFIKQWIWEGAPENGIVVDPIILNDLSIYEAPEFIPLEPPVNGLQYHIGPFDVYPNTEREFLYYVPAIEGTYYIDKIEISMSPGSHHFIAYMFPQNYGSPPNAYEYRDIHYPYIDEILPNGSLNFEWLNNVQTLQGHTFVTGTQWPSWSYDLPPGIALEVNSNFGLDLNPHYFNYTNETIQGEVYVNLHASLPQEVEKIAGVMQLGNNDISLPPNQETTLSKTYSFYNIVNSLTIDSPPGLNQINIFQLFSHAHQLMTRFDIYINYSNGDSDLIYTALDYEHPPVLSLDPPLRLNIGESLTANVTYNNTTDDYVHFGLLSTDEMMIIFGLLYFD